MMTPRQSQASYQILKTLMEHIDAIARKKQRDVLFLSFPQAERCDDPLLYEEVQTRCEIIEWLEANHVQWTECAAFADETAMYAYAGQIYLDIPFDGNDPVYQRVQAFLEYPDGSMRLENVMFWVVPLGRAMENRHHDEPGFWDRWADGFLGEPG
ncbi:hypothetical protein ACFQ3P_40945 [Paraburkholderia sabiae]|uniref:Uncharacterized protein n=1 Tax=Paraburkholderia sabiae TaxID=273251 RepID=A0ABU9QM35_9BURK|nr:hypothetical protein [Paraburkholderia sabiae]WJZ77272.1 hypothetical protein QEN71_34935 [Paraburkholderia sabiae]CAD6548267.1 hypothetical protein LMG24235_04552 [Paraburkholderia sabiae]